LLRTRIYIDGYNLYYGCLKGTHLKWLDLLTLFEKSILPSVTATVDGQSVDSDLQAVAIKFFTAPILEQAAKAHDSIQCQEGSTRFQCNNWRYANPALARGWPG